MNRKIKNILKFFLPYSFILYIKKNIKFVKFAKNFLETHVDLKDNRFTCLWKDRFPCLDDATQNTAFEPHYTYHTAWAARVLAQTHPKFHIDISSSLSFVVQVSAFIPIKFYDYRPAHLTLSGIECDFADLLSLPFSNNSINSLSCMHVVEHIGLGRYGDKFDPQGDIKAINELKRVVSVGGNLLFVVPLAEIAIIQYNAHRIYTYNQIKNYFNDFEITKFSLIKDDSSYIENAVESDIDGQKWACGCFLLKKTI